MAEDMGQTEFVLEDSRIAMENQQTRVSMTIVSEDTPPVIPHFKRTEEKEFYVDVMYCWCYSKMFDYLTETQCFKLKQTINLLMEEEQLNEDMIFELYLRVIKL